MNLYLIFILFFIIAGFLFDLIVEHLNIKAMSPKLPDEFIGFYDEEKYKTSQKYLKETTRFGLISQTVSIVLVLGFILLGLFNKVDLIARTFNYGPIATGLIFTGILMALKFVIDLPFSYYSIFVIEEKYGFNKTTIKTFVLDMLKAILLTIILGGIIISLILWFFEKTGANAWLYCWIFTVVFEIFILFISPVIIMPLFNKFIPIADGELKQKINEYAAYQKFKLKGIFTMDGSKRSTKANAFFTGFGKFRRIVLFDTLISKHTVDELVSVLAHEVGHFKKKHILKSIVISIITSGLMFYILSKFINNSGMFAAFKMENLSVYASLIFFSFLYAPLSIVISIFSNILSRKHEFEADKFAKDTYGSAEGLINGLKKLSVDNLSNLTPHPLKVFVEYSHPPVLQRIKKLHSF